MKHYEDRNINVWFITYQCCHIIFVKNSQKRKIPPPFQEFHRNIDLSKKSKVPILWLGSILQIFYVGHFLKLRIFKSLYCCIYINFIISCSPPKGFLFCHIREIRRWTPLRCNHYLYILVVIDNREQMLEDSGDYRLTVHG